MMSPHTDQTAHFRFSAFLRVAMACFTLLVMAPDAPAQSTDPARPTVIASAEITGQGPSEKTNFYYAFSAEPGEVSLAFEVKSDPKATTSVFDYEILDSRSRRLAGGNLDAARGETKQIIQTINLKGAGPQQLVLKLTVTPFVATYRVQFEGLVVAATSPAAAAVNPTETPATVPPAPASPPATPAQTSELKLLSFEFDAEKKSQTVKDLPSSGMLVVQMNDGTTREILLKDVKALTVKSQ